jgi:hypothetical protein
LAEKPRGAPPARPSEGRLDLVFLHPLLIDQSANSGGQSGNCFAATGGTRNGGYQLEESGQRRLERRHELVGGRPAVLTDDATISASGS